MQLRLARNETGEPEIFRSLQGEGPMAGRVRTFVRLSGCNLHCVWCDTAYTWNWRDSPFAHERDEPGAPHKFDPAKEMVKLEVADAVALIANLPAEAIVITGGEPLMQAEAVRELVRLVRETLPPLGIEMETNGTIAPGELADEIDLFVVSPKLAHSGNEAELALKSAPLKAFAALPNAVFKFVAREPEDVATAAALMEEYGVAPYRVMIMPEGTQRKKLRKLARALAPAVLAADFSFSDRLHVHLFGARRGV